MPCPSFYLTCRHTCNGLPVAAHPHALQGGSLIMNKVVEGQPVDAQALHIDSKKPGALSVFAAFETGKMLVVPLSHHVMQDALAADFIAHGGGVGDVEASQERLRELLEWIPPQYKLLELRYEPGDLIVMSGQCVHAGAAGEVGKSALRCHWYLESGQIVTERGRYVATHPLLAAGKEVAYRLCFPKCSVVDAMPGWRK